MTETIYDRPLTRAAALERLARGRADQALAMIAERVDRRCEENVDYGYGSIHGTLYEVLETCRRPYADSAAALLAVAALPARSAGLIGRLADRLAWRAFPLRRLSRATDPRLFLARIALSPEMLTQALICPAVQRMSGCEDILTDPGLTAFGIADALTARHPDAARAINAAAFAGTPLDLGTRRFYRIGDNRDVSIRIGDAQTGRIVYKGDLDPASADILVASLEADPDLAARFVTCDLAISRQTWRVRMSRRGLPREAPRTVEADALSGLYEARRQLVMAGMGEDAYHANTARIQAETDAWIAGNPR